MTGAARAASQQTVFSGSLCRSGSYSASDGSYASGVGYASFPEEVFCPIPRTQPTWQHLYVEIYFRNVNSPDGTLSTGTVSCSVRASNAQDSALGYGSDSMNGVIPGDSLFISVVNTPVAGESLWNAMNSATPMWREARIECDALPDGVRLLNYVVTEMQ